MSPVLVCYVYCRTTGERFAALKGVLVQEYVERLYPSDKGYHCVYAALLAKDAHEFSEVSEAKLKELN